uniref:Zinc finger, CCHC-type, retrotransposon Gag domain protein n=1 Tax=Tanacetum cinerariifolium TaxID=118510 RepID=A0A699R6I3_TANCI|nr:zinc finger, CCHC-type, retrotransposon Gag domain protein [Tanacetum cinerariifolium]
MQRFLRLAGFLGAAAGTAEEKAKNFQWGLHKSTLNHLMCIPFTDMVQVANAARNYEILYERDDDGAERPDKRQKSDRQGGGDNHRSNNNYSGNNNMLNFKSIRSSSTHKHDPNITV